MTSKPSRKTAGATVKKSQSKSSAAVKTEPAAPKAGGPPEPCAEADEVKTLLTGSMISMATKRIFGIVVYALAVFMALQLVWGGVKFAGRAIRLYRQFSQFREWNWDGDSHPIPLPDGDFGNIKKYIRKNFARSIPAKERDAAAQVFGEAADRVADGTLINRDDLLGFLGENLKPVCRAPGWIPLMTGLWSELNLSASATPETLEKACRAVADALSEVALVLASAAAPEEEEKETEPEPAPARMPTISDFLPDEISEEEAAADGPVPEAPTDGEPSVKAAESPCPGGNCPSGKVPQVMRYYNGYGWRWLW